MEGKGERMGVERMHVYGYVMEGEVEGKRDVERMNSVMRTLSCMGM